MTKRVFRRLTHFWKSQVASFMQAGDGCRPEQMTRGLQFPSPWIGRFDTLADFQAAGPALPGVLSVMNRIDDDLVASRHPIRYPAYCAACDAIQTMLLDWRIVGTTEDGSVHPAWTETSTCGCCGLNSRARALIGLVRAFSAPALTEPCYVAERVTSGYAALQRLFPNLTGSEYLGPDLQPGETKFIAQQGINVRHEDLTRLSFSDESYRWVLTQDVFEHIPDYHGAFRECARILKPGGRLVFTIPFNSGLETTQVRAVIVDGQVEHRLPPEVHGNPVSGGGSLCFQNFGWDILDALRGAGFSAASAYMYWAPWSGHIGTGGYVFSATK